MESSGFYLQAICQHLGLTSDDFPPITPVPRPAKRVGRIHYWLGLVDHLPEDPPVRTPARKRTIKKSKGVDLEVRAIFEEAVLLQHPDPPSLNDKSTSVGSQRRHKDQQGQEEDVSSTFRPTRTDPTVILSSHTRTSTLAIFVVEVDVARLTFLDQVEEEKSKPIDFML